MRNSSATVALDTVDPEIQRAIGDSRARRVRRLTGRELASALVLGGGFLAAAELAPVLLPASQRNPGAVLVLALVAGFGLAFTLDFDIVEGSFVPTQLVLVPMLFLVPLGWVPLLVAGGILLGTMLEAVRGTAHVERVFLRFVNGWYVLGPVIVLGIAGEAEPSMSAVPLYLAAFAAQLAFDYASTTANDFLAHGARPPAVLHDFGLTWLVDAGLASIGLAVAFAAVQSPYGLLLALPLLLLLSVFARDRKSRIDHELELSAAYRGTAFLLGDVIEADDAYTGSHSRDVVDLTLAVCDELGLSARERRDAEFVALLHDVGKVRTPSEIINKPGPLTAAERTVIETHTIAGEAMLDQVGGLLGEIGRLVRSCHERWDGEGYPDGIAGEEIPLIARIVCCCDAFNAMTTDRPYRSARSVDEALEEVARNAGTQFDPEIAAALARVARSV